MSVFDPPEISNPNWTEYKEDVQLVDGLYWVMFGSFEKSNIGKRSIKNGVWSNSHKKEDHMISFFFRDTLE